MTRAHPTLRLHLPRAAQSIDPRSGVDRTSGIVIKMLYEGLCRFNHKKEIEPAIARTITPSSDQKKYVFELRETFWSNGLPLTAYDFEYAWKDFLRPDFHSPYCFLFFPIKNAEAIKRGDIPMNEVGIEVVDDYTLAMTLEYPAPFILELVASWLFSPLCREIDQKHPGWTHHSGASHISNGPFKLDLWKLSDELQLMQNPLYWDVSNVKFDKVQISIIENESQALERFVKDELDWVGDPLSKIPPQKIADLKKSNILQTDRESYGLFWMQMNSQKMPFQNVHIRKAFAYGADRQKLIQEILQSDDTPAFGFCASNKQTNPPAFSDGDQERALQCFEKGLQELGITRQDLPPIVITHSDIEEQVAISQALAAQWRNLFGIEIQCECSRWNSYFDALARSDFMIGGLVWYPRYTDPVYFYDLFVSRSYAIKVSLWKDDAYEKLVHEAKLTTSKERKEQLLMDAEKILLEAMPAIPLFYQYSRHAKNPQLEGYISTQANQIDFRTAYLTQADATTGKD